MVTRNHMFKKGSIAHTLTCWEKNLEHKKLAGDCENKAKVPLKPKWKIR